MAMRTAADGILLSIYICSDYSVLAAVALLEESPLFLDCKETAINMEIQSARQGRSLNLYSPEAHTVAHEVDCPNIAQVRDLEPHSHRCISFVWPGIQASYSEPVVCDERQSCCLFLSTTVTSLYTGVIVMLSPPGDFWKCWRCWKSSGSPIPSRPVASHVLLV